MFKNNDVEAHSLAESANSMGRKNIFKIKPLYDCMQFELCVYMKHGEKTECLKTTSYAGGRGPGRNTLNEHNVSQLTERVLNFPTSTESGKDLLGDILEKLGLPTEEIVESTTGKVNKDPLQFLAEEEEKRSVLSAVQPTSSHRYKPNTILSSKRKKAGRPKNSKKPKVSINDFYYFLISLFNCIQ